MALDVTLDYRRPETLVSSPTRSYQGDCAECDVLVSWSHKAGPALYHILSTTRRDHFHQVRLDLTGNERHACSCEWGYYSGCKGVPSTCVHVRMALLKEGSGQAWSWRSRQGEEEMELFSGDEYGVLEEIMANDVRTTPVERFWARVEKSDGCWIWTGSTGDTGYGNIYVSKDQRTAATHRFSYELHYGPIPPGLCVCHKCDVRACVRPDHLFLGTYEDNRRDCTQKGRGIRGELVGSARLTEDQVRHIRHEREAYGLTYDQLAEKYDVHRITIADVITRKTWAHVCCFCFGAVLPLVDCGCWCHAERAPENSFR